MFLSYLCCIIFFVRAELIVNRVRIDVIDQSEHCKYCCKHETDFTCKEMSNIDVMTVAWCFTETIQFFAASALFFQLAAFNRLVSVLAGLTSANMDRQFSDFIEVSDKK